jgi:uncharacterized tellurite resistance protein B-like protein
MFDALKDLFDQFAQPAANAPQEREKEVRLASAVLLVEVMRADPDHDPAERAAVLQALHAKFGLSDEGAAQLVALAERTVESAYDYQHFTHALNEHFSQPQKIAMVEDLWRVAYADEHLGAMENHIISKIAGLLHVTHGEYIAAKLYARESLHLQPE